MSMYPTPWEEIPAETQRVARAACPKGTLAMRLREKLGQVYHDEHFVEMYPVKGQPAYAPWRLALVTVLQYVENLTDRQAAEAVRARLDWKYALGLALEDAGFDFSVLAEFRERLLQAGAEARLFEQVLLVCREQGWLKGGGKQRTDSTHVLARVRGLSNLECVGETLRAALDELAEAVPDWLLSQVSDEWFARYQHRVENYRLPKGEQERAALAQQIGEDGWHLLTAVAGERAPEGVADLPAVEVLRKVWHQYYESSGSGVRWRAGPQAEPGEDIIRSPYDIEAASGKKRGKSWLGYKVHLTETVAGPDEPRVPHLIVQVETTPASVQDVEVTEAIQEELAAHHLRPREHLVDTGYTSASLFVSSQQQGTELLGPVREDSSWQAKAGQGYDLAHFRLNWQERVATCPQGQTSERWVKDATGVKMVFATSVCAACPVRAACTHAAQAGRELQVQAEDAHEALLARRATQRTPEFQQRYAARAGIEGTISQAVRTLGLRRARYVGLGKTHLEHLLMATALNLVRLDALLTGVKRGTTRQSSFARLAGRRLSLARTGSGGLCD